MRCLQRRSGLRGIALARRPHVCGLGACNQREQFIVLDDFALEQALCDAVERVALVGERAHHAFVRFAQQPVHFVVDELGRARSRTRSIGSREHLRHGAIVGAVRKAEALAHAVAGHHVPCHRGGPLEVVFRAGGDVAEHQFLRCPAADQHVQPVEQLAAPEHVTVLGGHLLRVP